MLDADYSCGFVKFMGDGEGDLWRASIWRCPNRLSGHGVFPLELPQEVITQILKTKFTPTEDGVEVELKYAERLVERMFIADYDFQPIGIPDPPD